MLNHLLVVNTSYADDDVISQMQHLASRINAKLTLLRQISPYSDYGRDHFVDPLDWHILKVEAKTSLDSLADKLRRENIEIYTDVIDGSEIDDLVVYAQSHAVDLIVLNEKMQNVNDLMHNLMRHCNIPIIVLKQKPSTVKEDQSYKKIVVPLDGSQRAESALTMAAFIAQAYGGELIIAHVVQKPEMPRRVPLSTEDLRLSEKLVESNRKQVANYLDYIASLLPCSAKVSLTVNENVTNALQSIIDEENADLVVLSAHGYTGDPQEPCGHITRSVISSSRVPVLTIQDLHIAKSPVDSHYATTRQTRVR